MLPTVLLTRVTAWPTIALAIALASAAAYAASPFEGKWKVQDTRATRSRSHCRRMAQPRAVVLAKGSQVHGRLTGIPL